MSIKCLSINGYPHLYRSMIRFLHLDPYSTRSLLYQLYTANLDSFRDRNPCRTIRELDFRSFCLLLLSRARPYRTEVQLYKSMECLLANVCVASITLEQREARDTLLRYLKIIDWNFLKSFGLDITHSKTVYAHCAFNLIPRKNEPFVCLARFHEPNVMMTS